ncbi:MAG: hypothetical protein ACK41W_05635 [Cyanobacteriota bacterium]
MDQDRQRVALGLSRPHRRIALPRQALEPIGAAAVGTLPLRHHLHRLLEGFHRKGSRPSRRSFQLLARRLQRLRVGG